MDEYIKRESAIKRFSFATLECLGMEPTIRAADVVAALKSVPADDVVPVVRCKDCKHRRDDDFCGGRGWPEQLVPDDGYCDNGARKDGDA